MYPCTTNETNPAVPEIPPAQPVEVIECSQFDEANTRKIMATKPFKSLNLGCGRIARRRQMTGASSPFPGMVWFIEGPDGFGVFWRACWDSSD